MYDSEKQRDNLREYLKLLETMIRKSTQVGQLTKNLTSKLKKKKLLRCTFKPLNIK